MRQGKWHAVSGKCIACIACELDIRKTWVELHGAFDSRCARFGVQQRFIQVEEVRGARCDRKQALFYSMLGILTWSEFTLSRVRMPLTNHTESQTRLCCNALDEP